MARSPICTEPAGLGRRASPGPGPGQDGTIDLANLRTGQRGRATPVVDPGQNQPIMLVSGWIVYVSNNGVRATNAVTGKTRVLGKTLAFAPSAAPGDVWLGWVTTHGGNWAWSVSEIAPSGQMMAAEAVVPPDSQGTARVFIPHLTGRDTQPTAVPSSAAFLLSVTAWSPDSSWLFYQGPGQQMWAYQVTTGQARSSITTCCQYAVMATIDSPPG